MSDLKDEEIRRALAAEALTYEAPQHLAAETLAAAEAAGEPGPLGRIRGRLEARKLRRGAGFPKWAFAGMALVVLVGLYGVGSMFGLNGTGPLGPGRPPLALTEGRNGQTDVGGHGGTERDMSNPAQSEDQIMKRDGSAGAGGNSGQRKLGFDASNPRGDSGDGGSGGRGGTLAADVPAGSRSSQPQTEPAPGTGGIRAPGTVPVPGAAAGVPNAAVGPGVIRTGDMEVRVRKGRFGTAWASATNIAADHGGFVASSSADQVKGRLSRGILTVRIPAAKFDVAVADFQGLGRVVRMTTSSSDVSGQLVDFDARIRAAQARELQLLELLRQARSVSDSLQVSTALAEVRTEIESLQAQRQNLQNQVEFAALTVSIYEPQAAPEPPRPVAGGLSAAWERALVAATITLSTIVIGAGFIMPLVVLALIIWGGLHLRRRVALR